MATSPPESTGAVTCSGQTVLTCDQPVPMSGSATIKSTSTPTLSAVATPRALALPRVPRTFSSAIPAMITSATIFFPTGPSGMTAPRLSPAATASVATLPLAITTKSVQPNVNAAAGPKASRIYA